MLCSVSCNAQLSVALSGVLVLQAPPVLHASPDLPRHASFEARQSLLPPRMMVFMHVTPGRTTVSSMSYKPTWWSTGHAHSPHYYAHRDRFSYSLSGGSQQAAVANPVTHQESLHHAGLLFRIPANLASLFRSELTWREAGFLAAVWVPKVRFIPL